MIKKKNLGYPVFSTDLLYLCIKQDRDVVVVEVGYKMLLGPQGIPAVDKTHMNPNVL